MNKLIKGILIAAASFVGIGVILAVIGVVGGGRQELNRGKTEALKNVVELAPDRISKEIMEELSISGEDGGLSAVYDNVEYDEGHDIVSGTFSDENIGGINIRKLDIEMGAGELKILEGSELKLEKNGNGNCQYYIEGDTFYLKQRGGDMHHHTNGGHHALDKVILTLPSNLQLEEADISMGAGELLSEISLAADEIDIEVGAGTVYLEEVKANEFSAEIGAGDLTVHTLDARNCDAEVSMGSITVENGMISGNLEAEVNMGEINFSLRDAYENHSYEVECNMGEIHLGNVQKMNRYSGLSNELNITGKNAGNSCYELSCNAGSIEVCFKE